MKITLDESRKENGIYYQGAFWIIGNSFLDILRGNFKIEGELLESDYEGNYINFKGSPKQLTHQKLWKHKFCANYEKDKDYTFYPRGRVSIYKGVAFIHLNSKCNTPKIIDSIINKYNIHKLQVEIDLNDTYQGSHYNFQLK